MSAPQDPSARKRAKTKATKKLAAWRAKREAAKQAAPPPKKKA